MIVRATGKTKEDQAWCVVMQKTLKENERDTGDEKSCDGSVQKGKQIKIDFNAFMRAKEQTKEVQTCVYW